MRKLFMGSIALTTFAAAIAIFQIASCKKTNAEPPRECPTPIYPVAGIYTGTYSVTTMPELGNRYYSFAVFPDGTLLTKGLTEFGDTAYHKGNWALSPDSVFTATIKTFTTPSVIQNITGIVSNDGKISNATWQDIYNSGQFSTMQRVN